MRFVDLTTNHSRHALIGPDATRYLNGQVSNDVTLCTGTHGIAACVCNAKGKLEGTVNVAAIDKGYIVDFPSILDETLPVRLDRYLIADECEWTDRSDDTAHLHVLGEDANSIAAIVSIPTLAISNQPRWGQCGVDIIIDAAQVEDVKNQLTVAGATQLTSDEIHSLRIANRAPAWGAEMTTDSLPQELGLESDYISFTKGCYIGQETISRIKSVGRVNRQLVALRSESPLILGAEIRLADNNTDSKPLGIITSVDPVNQEGLALVHRKALDPTASLIATDTENSLSTPLIILQSKQNS